MCRVILRPVETSIWVPAAVALVVGVATVLATRRWGTRRRKLLFRYQSASLLPTDSRPGLLEVTFRDIPVPNPHLVTIRLQNVGPSDVATHHFDGGRPIRVVLDCKFFGVTSTTHPSATVSPAIGSDGWIEMRPMLLRRGEEWAVEAVVEGDPAPTLQSSLIDTDVEQGGSARDQLAEFLSGIVLTGPFGITIRLPR